MKRFFAGQNSIHPLERGQGKGCTRRGKAAFTLAEVLITLGIIGVVSALTIPALIQKYQERSVVIRLTKVYSQLNEAYKLMQEQYGPVVSWGVPKTDTGKTDKTTGQRIYDYTAQRLVASRIQEFLKSKPCSSDDPVCTERSTYYTLSGIEQSLGFTNNPESKFYLLDGTFIGIGWYASNITKGDSIDIYVILKNKNAVLGKDIFYFLGVEQGLFPEGKDYGNYKFSNCKPNLINSSEAGRGCSAWVIKYKNLDYLHCRNKLSWDGAHSCKDK